VTSAIGQASRAGARLFGGRLKNGALGGGDANTNNLCA
jgi:hypothetical protein